MKIEDIYLKAKKTIDVSILLAACCAMHSCVLDERYNAEHLKDIDLTMNLFSKGVEIPVGSTSQLNFDDLASISGADFCILNESADGSYSISYGDSFDLSSNIQSLELESLASIDAIDYKDEFNYHLGIDRNKLGINGESWNESSEIGFSGIRIPDLKPIDREEKIPLGLYDENISAALSLDDELTDIHIRNGFGETSTASLSSVSRTSSNSELVLGDIAPVVLDTYRGRILVDHKLEGVESISDIELSSDAKMVVTLSITNSYLTSGSLVPNVDVDLTKICGVEGFSGKVVNIKDMVMDASNGYKATRTYDISGLVKNSFSDGRIYFDENVTVAGQIEGYGLKTTYGMLAEASAKGGMFLNLDVQFENIDIETADVVLKPLTVVTDDITVPMNISPVVLPSMVDRIESVSFDRTKKTVLEIDASNLAKLKGLDVNLDEVTVEFPAGLHVDGCTDNKLVIKGAKLPLRKEITISSMDFPAPVSGIQSFSGAIKVKARATASGSIDAADIPSKEEDDVIVVASISGSPVISDFAVRTKDYVHEINMDKEFDLNAEGIGDLGGITVVPEGLPTIDLVLRKPSISAIAFKTGSNGITITMPQCVRLDAGRMGNAYTYDSHANTITVKGSLPERVSLPVKEFHISSDNAVQKITVDGSMVASAAELGKSDIEALEGSSIGIEVVIPDMKAKSIRLDDGLSVRVDQEASVTLLPSNSIPEFVNNVSEIVLDDVFVKCNLAFEGLPGNGEYRIDLVATLPEYFSPSEIALRGTVRNGRFTSDPVRLDSIHGLDLSKNEDITGDIKLRGSVSTDDTNIDLDKLQEDIKASIQVNICDKEGKIGISRIKGRMDQEMTYSTMISFDDVPDFLKSGDVCLDIKNPRLALKLHGNMGIPFNAELGLVPWRNGRADGNVVALKDAALPYSVEPDSFETVELSLDPAQVARVFRQIPDSLEIVFLGAVDPSKDCIIVPDADYALDVTYDFDMPLAPGEDFMIVLSDTIELSKEIVDVMAQTPIGLKISAKNTMPFGLRLFVDFLDADGNILYISEDEVSAGISGGNRNQPATSDVQVMVKAVPGSPVSEVAMLKLSFALTGSPDTHTLSKEDYIVADIKAVLPEGISFKINR